MAEEVTHKLRPIIDQMRAVNEEAKRFADAYDSTQFGEMFRMIADVALALNVTIVVLADL